MYCAYRFWSKGTEGSYSRENSKNNVTGRTYDNHTVQQLRQQAVLMAVINKLRIEVELLDHAYPQGNGAQGS